MKTFELEGALLDYWVAQKDPRCEGLRFERREDHFAGVCDEGVVCCYITESNLSRRMQLRRAYDAEEYAPSRDWGQCGLFIEREKIAVVPSPSFPDQWVASIRSDARDMVRGPTPLVAAMRLFVFSRFGEDVPEVAP